MGNHTFRIAFEMDVNAASVGEAVEMAKEAVLLDYATVMVNGEELEAS